MSFPARNSFPADTNDVLAQRLPSCVTVSVMENVSTGEVLKMGLSRWLVAAGVDPDWFRGVATRKMATKNFGAPLEPGGRASDAPAGREDEPSATLDPGVETGERSGDMDGDSSRLVWFSVYERARPVLDQTSRLLSGLLHAASTAARAM
jgi:hypothetical protein